MQRRSSKRDVKSVDQLKDLMFKMAYLQSRMKQVSPKKSKLAVGSKGSPSMKIETR